MIYYCCSGGLTVASGNFQVGGAQGLNVAGSLTIPNRLILLPTASGGLSTSQMNILVSGLTITSGQLIVW